MVHMSTATSRGKRYLTSSNAPAVKQLNRLLKVRGHLYLWTLFSLLTSSSGQQPHPHLPHRDSIGGEIPTDPAHQLGLRYVRTCRRHYCTLPYILDCRNRVDVLGQDKHTHAQRDGVLQMLYRRRPPR